MLGNMVEQYRIFTWIYTDFFFKVYLVNISSSLFATFLSILLSKSVIHLQNTRMLFNNSFCRHRLRHLLWII